MYPVTVYNTLTQRKEEIKGRGLDPSHVNLYVCGPTVYDKPHIGHARSYVFFDTLKKVLRASGYTVTHLQNFSDVDEKIDATAAAEKTDVRTVSDRNIDAFLNGMDRLMVSRADRYVRASENRQFMHHITGLLLASGRCYRAGENIYFDASTGGGFGSLLHDSLQNLICGNEAESYDFVKHNMEDFTIWLGDYISDDWKAGGRPSWNIECFSIVHRWFGCELDIQGGGLDLVFPHHEVGSVISRSYCRTEFASYYIHNAYVTMNADKMSKSLRNFVYLDELLEKHTPAAIRLYVLSHPFTKNMEFRESDLTEYEALQETLYNEMKKRGMSPTGAAVPPLRDGRMLRLFRDNIQTDQVIEILREQISSLSNEELMTAIRLLGLV
ncbi:MAG: class I tRNA ligase family protein [Methanomassiliicoccales archaeon]